MTFDRGAGRLLKLLSIAYLAERVFSGLPLLTRFPVVFLSALLADSLRARDKSETPLYLEDAIGSVLVYASAGFLSGWLDSLLFLSTGRHAGPVVPAVLFALVQRVWTPGRYYSGRG